MPLIRRLICLVCCLVMLPVTVPVAANPKRLEADKRLLQTYRKMLKEDPTQEYAYKRLLRVSHTVGGVRGLVKIYSEATRQTPRIYALWVVLGHLHRTNESPALALKAYTKAAEIKPKAAAPHLAMAKVHQRAQAWAQALAAYDRAVARAKGKSAKQDILRNAAEAALESKDDVRADAYYKALIKTAPRNMFLRMDYAQLLARLGRKRQALSLWKALRKRAKGQLKHLVIIWREMAELSQALKEDVQAEKVVREALKKTPEGHWARTGFIETLISIYRRLDKLELLIKEFEPRAKRSYQMLVTTARLYEEVADDPRALVLFRKASKRRPSDTRVKMKVIKLLERIGKPSEVIAAYKALIKASPQDARHQVRLAEILFHRGKTKAGLTLLGKVSKRFRTDPGVHQQVIDLMLRYGGKTATKKIEAEYRLLRRLEPREPSHVISLGELYWSRGERKKALATWKLLLKMGRSKGHGHFLLAEVYADHNMPQQATKSFEQALSYEPHNPRFAKAYALVLEKYKRFGNALDQWRRILAKPGKRTAASLREARRRIIGLWERGGRLKLEIRRLEVLFSAQPPDLEAGHFLAAVYLRLRRFEQAQRVLQKIHRLNPKNINALVGLELVYTRQNKLEKAIKTLERLAEVNSRGASEYMHRAADLSLSLGKQAMALGYMRKVVKLNPADPLAHSRVAELHLRMMNLRGAAASWRQALLLDPRNHRIQFKLASVYRDLGSTLREEQVLSDIVREAREPADAFKAGRRLLKVATHTGRLEAIESVIRPLVFNRRHKEIYLKLLIDLYAGLARQYEYGLGPRAERREKLARLGHRALKPALDALFSSDLGLQARALDVLTLTRPAGAAASLSRIASAGDQGVDFQAVVALGKIGSAASVTALAKLVEGPDRRLKLVAIWALGLIGSKASVELLIRHVTKERLDLRMWTALALGQHAGKGKTCAACTDALIKALKSTRANYVKEALVLSLGRFGSKKAVEPISAVLRTSFSRLRTISAWALGRIDTPSAHRALVDRMWMRQEHRGNDIASCLVMSPTARDDRDLDKTYRALINYRLARMYRSHVAPILTLGTCRSTHPKLADARLQRLTPALKERVDRILSSRYPKPTRLLLGSMLRAGSRLSLKPLAHAGVSPQASDRLAREILKPLGPQLMTLMTGDPELAAPALQIVGRMVHDLPHGITLSRLKAIGQRALANEDPGLSMAAATMFGRMRSPPSEVVGDLALARLRELDSDRSTLFKLALVKLLARLSAPRFSAPFMRLLSDPSSMVREAVLRVYRSRPLGTMLNRILALSSDPVAAVRYEAMRVLARSNEPRARLALEALMKRSDSVDRRVLKKILSKVR